MDSSESEDFDVSGESSGSSLIYYYIFGTDFRLTTTTLWNIKDFLFG
jgi:hypothetical protein